MCNRNILTYRYEINNPAFALTASWDVTPTSLIYQNYAQNQITEVGFTQMLASPNTQMGDVFNFTINGTTYTAVTDGISSTLNLTAPAPNNLILQLEAWLDATLPNHNVTSNASTLTFEAINPGVAFTLTAAASSSLAPGTSVVTRPAAYFEISGTASNSTNAPTTHTYTLTSAGPGCLGV